MVDPVDEYNFDQRQTGIDRRFPCMQQAKLLSNGRVSS